MTNDNLAEKRNEETTSKSTKSAKLSNKMRRDGEERRSNAQVHICSPTPSLPYLYDVMNARDGLSDVETQIRRIKADKGEEKRKKKKVRAKSEIKTR